MCPAVGRGTRAPETIRDPEENRGGGRQSLETWAFWPRVGPQTLAVIADAGAKTVDDLEEDLDRARELFELRKTAAKLEKHRKVLKTAGEAVGTFSAERTETLAALEKRGKELDAAQKMTADHVRRSTEAERRAKRLERELMPPDIAAHLGNLDRKTADLEAEGRRLRQKVEEYRRLARVLTDRSAEAEDAARAEKRSKQAASEFVEVNKARAKLAGEWRAA